MSVVENGAFKSFKDCNQAIQHHQASVKTQVTKDTLAILTRFDAIAVNWNPRSEALDGDVGSKVDATSRRIFDSIGPERQARDGDVACTGWARDGDVACTHIQSFDVRRASSSASGAAAVMNDAAKRSASRLSTLSHCEHMKCQPGLFERSIPSNF